MKKKILVVEDDLSLSKILCIDLEKHDFEAIAAYDGKEGLEKTISEMPDVVLLDIIMPVMDGLKYLEEKKFIKNIKDIPVIILSNLSSPVLEEESKDLNFSDYLIKSDWKLADVIKKIHEKID
ncbi:MAG: response regulator [Candidatus Berkelbacteria bacterium]|nr:response regulator [Candidatus Berkelbacteria bacterium]